MIYRLILPGRMSVGVSSRWGKNVFSFVGNVKISVSESDQNDVQEGEERGSNLIRFKPQGGAMEQEKIRLEGEVHLFIYYFKRFI